MKNARQIAFEILNKIQRDNSYSNLTLDSNLDNAVASDNDKRLISAIVYGVIERKVTLDYQLKINLTQPIKKLKPQVLTALRIGAYQILYMDKIPNSAAVNESVKLVKNNQASFASGLVNAVLRKIDKNGLILPETASPEYLQIKYSCHKWLIDLWDKSYGRENTINLLESSFGCVNTTIKVNTLKTTADELIVQLSEEGFEAEKGITDNSIVIKKGGALHKTKCYEDGLFHVQDYASQYCCKALDIQEGETVLDICSAPGGKSFTIAENMNDSGKIISMDIYQNRLDLIKSGALRLGIDSIETLINDGTKYNDKICKADKILCDVPCAGLGVIRKKPEIRYKNYDEISNLFNIQYSILCTSSHYLKKGGTLIYSTCSLNPEENENVLNRFLDEHEEFESIRILPDMKRVSNNSDYITLMPHIHGCDGFFIGAIKKK